MNFLKSAATKVTNTVKELVDSSDEDSSTAKNKKRADEKKNKNKKGNDDSSDDSSSISSINSEDAELAGEIVADVFTAGLYGEIVMAVEAAEYAKYMYDENRKNKALEWLRGRRVVLLRHGNAGKAKKDEKRRLTPAGEGQCAAFRSEHASRLGGIVHAFCSPTARTVETTRNLGFPKPVSLKDLYFGAYDNEERADDMHALDNELGYAPLSDYLRGDGEEIYAPVRIRLGYALGSAGLPAVADKGGDVLVVGHATYLSLLALEVLEALKKGLGEEAAGALDGGEDAILSFNVGEVEGFEISEKGGVYLLRNGKSG